MHARERQERYQNHHRHRHVKKGIKIITDITHTSHLVRGGRAQGESNNEIANEEQGKHPNARVRPVGRRRRMEGLNYFEIAKFRYVVSRPKEATLTTRAPKFCRTLLRWSPSSLVESEQWQPHMLAS